MPELGRFRVNVASQRGSLALVLRHIPITLPTVETLGLPKVMADIAMTERGLVLPDRRHRGPANRPRWPR